MLKRRIQTTLESSLFSHVLFSHFSEKTVHLQPFKGENKNLN